MSLVRRLLGPRPMRSFALAVGLFVAVSSSVAFAHPGGSAGVTSRARRTALRVAGRFSKSARVAVAQEDRIAADAHVQQAISSHQQRVSDLAAARRRADTEQETNRMELARIDSELRANEHNTSTQNAILASQDASRAARRDAVLERSRLQREHRNLSRRRQSVEAELDVARDVNLRGMDLGTSVVFAARGAAFMFASGLAELNGPAFWGLVSTGALLAAIPVVNLTATALRNVRGTEQPLSTLRFGSVLRAERLERNAAARVEKARGRAEQARARERSTRE